MSLLTARGKERKSRNDVPIHRMGFTSPFIDIPVYVYSYIWSRLACLHGKSRICVLELHDLTPKKIKNSLLLFSFSGLPRYMREISPMPKQDNRRCSVCHHERSLLNSPMRAVCVHEVSLMSESTLKVIGVVKQERRGTRLAGRDGSPAAKAAGGGARGGGVAVSSATDKKKGVESSPRFTAGGRCTMTCFTIPLTTHP